MATSWSTGTVDSKDSIGKRSHVSRDRSGGRRSYSLQRCDDEREPLKAAHWTGAGFAEKPMAGNVPTAESSSRRTSNPTAQASTKSPGIGSDNSSNELGFRLLRSGHLDRAVHARCGYDDDRGEPNVLHTNRTYAGGQLLCVHRRGKRRRCRDVERNHGSNRRLLDDHVYDERQLVERRHLVAGRRAHVLQSPSTCRQWNNSHRRYF